MEDIKINCPKCIWEPTVRSRWICSCRTSWNTFDTAARCPGCSKIWKDTQCLKCHQWSPHLDWYEGLDEIINKLKAEIEKGWEVPVEL